MKKIALLLFCLLFLTVACKKEKTETPVQAPTLTTQQDKVSYSIGMDIGSTIQKQGLDVDPALVALGMKDAFANGTTLLTSEEAKDVLVKWQQEMMQKKVADMKKEADANAAKGKAFLEENAHKEGVVTLPSGLQYKIVEEGSGKKPAASDVVTVNYKGTLIDGTEFDSSYARKQPATFPVNGVIKGWTEALQLMKTGAHWMLYIPAELAYGERQAGPKIAPNSTLIFDVTLISINDKK